MFLRMFRPHVGKSGKNLAGRMPSVRTLVAVVLIATLTASVAVNILPAPAAEASSSSTTLYAVADGYAWSGGTENPSGADSTCEKLRVGFRTAAGNYRTMIKFDLSEIPAGATITNADLKLYYYAYSSGSEGNPLDISVYRTTADWYEGGLSWSKAENYNSYSYDTVTIIAGSGAGYKTWDITSLVQNWVDGTYNDYGVLLRAPTQSGSSNFRSFRSKEYGSNVPRLEVTYTPSAPTLSFTNLTPSTITTSDSTYDATLSATGTNFNNVNRVTFTWSGPDSGTDIWDKGGSEWNSKVTVNSDTSMTLRPRVLSNETQSGTWTWTVTLRDISGATASQSFKVTYKPTLSFTNLTPSTITTSESTYDATLSATGTNFNNVNRVTFTWSGPDSGTDIWDKGGSDWSSKVTVNSDTSMTLRPRVLSNETQSGTWTWTVTLRDISGATASQYFTVAYTPPPPPTAPTLTDVVGTSNSVLLGWTDNSNNEDGFKVERKEGTSGTYTQIGTTGANVNVYADSGLQFGKVYCYWVRAYNSAGNSGYSSQKCATTLSTPILSSPSNGATLNTNTVTLTWNPVAGADGYAIKVSKISCGGGDIFYGASISCQQQISNLANGVYYWQVQAAATTYPGLSAYSPCRYFTIAVEPPDNPPTADFSADVTSCCEPLTVQFTDQSTAGDNSIVSWSWDFGDGDTSTAQNPGHTYNSAGTYTVSLTVTDSHGCSDTETKVNYITANEGPTANFSADMTSYCEPLAVQFTDESTAGSNPIISWSWDFGDGDTSTAQNPTNTYDTSGTYTVSLTVTDEHGCSDTETKTDYITAKPKPIASASSNSPVNEGATIQLYGGPDGIASYYWTGPGGWTSSLQNPTRPNAATVMAGTYTLVVTNEHGCSDDATTTVLVVIEDDTTPPTVFSVSPQDGQPDVAIDTVVTATFSEAMDSSTITTDSFTLAGSAVSGTVTYDPATYTATFTPDANLEYNHEYIATLSTAITDLAGNPLAKSYTWSFTTESPQNHSPVASSLSLTGQPEIMYPNTAYTVTAAYHDPDGRHDLKYCYLRLNHPEKPLTMMWNQATGEFWTYAGEEGENYLTVSGWSIAMADTGYEINWTFEINENWPEAENAISFGICASDDSGLESGWDYDDTNASFTVLNTIQQHMVDHIPVTVDSNQYYIVLLDGCINPITLAPTDSLLVDHEPNAWIVYTDENFEPLSDKDIVVKIDAIKRANHLVQHGAGTSDGISNTIATIRDVIAADADLAGAEFIETLAKITAFEVVDLVNPLIVNKATAALSTVTYNLVDYYTDPKQYELRVGRAFLEGAVNHYEEAKSIAEEYYAGIDDYETAKNYLECYYWGYFEYVYGTGIVLSNERINENPFVTVAMWVPEYILHMSTQLVSHISIWDRIGTTTVKGASILKNGVDIIAELPDYLSTLNEITNDVGQLLKDETFLVDYTLSLATQSMTPLLKWWVIGVDAINSDICSPGELRVFDSLDRVTGMINGEIVQEIPDSVYDTGASTVTIFNPTGFYTYEIAGTGEGSYGLDITYLLEGQLIIFTATEIPTTTGAIHDYAIDWDTLSEGEGGVTIRIDSDGDGEFEREFTCDEELTQDEFMSQFSGCFIATAAYGTPMAEEIEILREFRDEYLLTNPIGRALVDVYYRVSPPIAEFITEHTILKPIVRAGLLPAVAMSTLAINTTPAQKMAIVGLLVLVSVALAVWATRRRGKDPECT